MSGHGPDAATFEKASHADLSRVTTSATPWPSCSRPRAVIRPTAQAMAALTRQADYQACWAGLQAFQTWTPHE
jgi:homogentisate 1,2-dioxygenase